MCDKTLGLKHLREGKICLTFHPSSQEFNQELRPGIWRQELVPRQWRSAVYWLALHEFLSLLFYMTQCHLPRNSIILTRLGSPYQSLVKKISDRLANGPLKSTYFLKWNFIIDDSNLCQVDCQKKKNNLTRTTDHLSAWQQNIIKAYLSFLVYIEDLMSMSISQCNITFQNLNIL